MKKNNFFKILVSVCSGTKIFPEIVKNSIFRVLFHLILISILCAAVFVVIRTPELKRNISEVTSFLQKEFGNVVVKKDGVYPENNPKKERSLSYSSVQISYYPTLPEEKNFQIDDKLDNLGFIWLPSGITGWIRLDASRYVVYQGITSKDSPQWFSVTNKEGIYPYLKSNQIDNYDSIYTCLCAPLPGDIPLFMLLAPLPPGINTFLGFVADVYWYSAIMAAVKIMIMIIFNALFYSLLFALFFSISGRRSPKREYTFKTAFNTAIYAGFPAIIIGILFTIAKMAWLEYQTVYLIAMFIYLIVITQKNKRNRIKTNGNEF
jgi:hypothetical protein